MNPRSQRRLGVIRSVAICAWLLFVRVHDIDNSFWMLDDQIRDWGMIQRAFGDLPLSGPRSPNSGVDIGPAYYWFLWASRELLEPLFGNFPHTGGWAISLLQTIGDFTLLIALWRHLDSWPVAAAIVLLVGSAPLDAGLTATVWNPPISVAFVKLATASLLWQQPTSTATSATSIACAWLAVQMHPSAIVVALPITLWLVYAAAATGGLRQLTVCGLVFGCSLSLVFLPFFFNPMDRTTGVAASLSSVVRDPLGHHRVGDSAAAILHALDAILANPFDRGWLGWAIVIGACVLLVRRPLSSLSLCSAAVIAMSVAVFSLWQGDLSQVYRFLVVAPAGAICLLAPIAMLKRRYRQWTAYALLGLIAVFLPARAEVTWTIYRLPAYGPLSRGATAAAASGHAIRGIKADFAIPPGMDPLFLFALAGGRLEATSSSKIVVIHADGSVRFQPP